ncbi:MAG: antitoxin family protein [Archaeoglobus sp.]|nr:antitoxin family protein [Archaeoglobus sp.]
MPIEVVFENGVFKPLKKGNLPKKGKYRVVILSELEKDVEEVFGILKEPVNLEEIRKEWDRDVSG